MCLRRLAFTESCTNCDELDYSSWGGCEEMFLSEILCDTRATCMPAPSSVVPFWDLRTRGRIRRVVQGKLQTERESGIFGG